MSLLYGLEPALLGGFLLLVVGTFHVMLATVLTYLLLTRVPTQDLWIREIHKVWYIPIFGSLWAGWTLLNLGKPLPSDGESSGPPPNDTPPVNWSREIRSLEDEIF